LPSAILDISANNRFADNRKLSAQKTKPPRSNFSKSAVGYMSRFHLPNPQNGCVKSIEYYQLKAAPLAGECREIFVAAIFTLHAGKTVV
jgi:hypothetical protein